MNVTKLGDFIRAALRDPAIEDQEILDTINDGVYYVADMVLLHELRKTDTVDTVVDTAYASMPSDYHREIYLVEAVDTTKPKVELVFDRMDANIWHGMVVNDGPVETVYVEDDYLYYRPIPTTAQTLRVHYYRKPTTLSFSSTITEIPSEYIKDTVGNYVLWKLYGRFVEDGLEGERPNTMHFYNVMNIGLENLKRSYKNHARLWLPLRNRMKPGYI